MIEAIAASAAVLLAVAGLAKLRAPAPAVTMLIAAVRPLRTHRRLLAPLVRVAAALEVAIGVAVLAIGGRVPAVLLCLAYLSFVALTLRLVQAGAGTSCGCFGSTDSPVGPAHAVVNVCAAVAAGYTIVRPAGRLGGFAADGVATAVTGTVQLVLLAWLAVLAMTALPALAAERRRLEAHR